MQIKTDTKEIDEAKDASSCLISQLYKHLVDQASWENICKRYEKGGLAYGYYKQDLFDAHQAHFKEAQERYNEIIAKPKPLYELLGDGSKKARATAKTTLNQVKEALGFY